MCLGGAARSDSSPIASVAPEVKDIFIGPGSVFSLDQLLAELDVVPGIYAKTIYFHEGAVILNTSHSAMERIVLNKISSTMQGSMAAMMDKMQRNDQLDVRVKSQHLPIERFNIHVT